MAKYSCSSCDDLRQDAPDFIIDGLDDDACTSLQNDTGLNASSGNNDCTDLHNLNDCLIGQMENEVDSYSACDWKDFMKQFIPNLWTTAKGIICSICGIWTNIHNLWTLVNKLECMVNYMMKGAQFKFTETADNTTSYIVAGRGVSFANVSQSGTAGDLEIEYISGGVCTIGGSVKLYAGNNVTFTDRISGYCYDDNGVNPTKTASRKGNSAWNGSNTKPGGHTSQLVYEIRILKSEYPEIKRFFGNTGLNMDGGGYHAEFIRIGEGKYAPGQYGDCNREDGTPDHSGDSQGHKVKAGWEYIQCRITWVEQLSGDNDGSQVSPRGFIGVRMNQAGIDCD